MSSSRYIPTDTGQKFEVSYVPVIIFSILFHVLAILVVPFVTTMLWKPKTFTRPKTFQLVSVSAPVRKKSVRQKSVKKTVVKKKKKIVKKSLVKKTKVKSKPIPKQTEVEEEDEDLTDLANLLGTMNTLPAEISSGSGGVSDWYINSILSKIERNWRPPSENPNLSVSVLFSILVNGTITNVSVKKSSGNGTLDNMALRAVRLSAPFGKLPPNFRGNKLDITLTLRPTKRS